MHGNITNSASVTSGVGSYVASVGQPQPQLDQRLQQLKLQHAKIDEEEVYCNSSSPRSPLAYKGSITQGVPAAPTAVSPTPMSSLIPPQPPTTMAHSCSFDEAYDTQ